MCDNKYYSLNSSEISISSTKINSCQDVANFLQNIDVIWSVTENIYIVPNGNKFLQEKWYSIKIGTHEPNLINTNFWNKNNNEFGLKCAYLHIDGKYKRYILNYLRESSCPSKY